jgi:hypothetical protein
MAVGGHYFKTLTNEDTKMNEPTRILVDGSAGHYAAENLLTRYPTFVEHDGHMMPLPDYLASEGETLEAVFNPENPECGENIDWLIDGRLIVKNDDGEYWVIAWNDGDLIAINPLADWCDQCEAYHMPLPSNVTSYRVGAEFVAALVNSDNSGITDWEENQLLSFEARETKGIEYLHWSCNSDHTEEFEECEITGLRGNTVELHLVNMDGVKVE